MKLLKPLVRTVNTSTTPLPDKIKDPVYNTPAFRIWRAAVLRRAGYRCEAMDQYGMRCTRAYPGSRMYADHVVELKDGGSLVDINNGQCLCASHHEIKTLKERSRRLKS